MTDLVLNSNVYTSPITGDGYAVIHTGACRFMGMVVENQTGGTIWAQVHDGYATPANDSKPVLSIRLAANAQATILLPSVHSISLLNGLTICSSSTGKKLTVGAPTDLFITAFWA